jgi:transcriptional regulator, tetR family
MTEYVVKFMEKGIIRQLKHPELTTILIIETLSWWTMDMRYTSFETLNIPTELAKEVCLDNIISAYKI